MLQELDLDAIPGKKEIVQNDEEISMMLDGATVIQILWSMLPPPDVPDGRSSLLIVHYPKQWRDKKSAVLTEFLQAFGKVLRSRNYSCCIENCESCDDKLSDVDEPFINQDGQLYGIANHICAQCKKNH